MTSVFSTPADFPLAHVCLGDAARESDTSSDVALDIALDAAQLNDQQRFALVLQAAALLAHLRDTDLGWPKDWNTARVDPDGMLRLPRTALTSERKMPQWLLRRLLQQLFRGETISGRGEARRAARELLERWRQNLVPISLDQIVEQILDAVEFLWQPGFARVREALAGAHRIGDTWRPWMVGPGWARRRFLDDAADATTLAARLADAAARDVWDGYEPGDQPAELARQRAWRRAAAAWRREPPKGAGEIVAHAEALFALGRYSRASEALKGRREIPARVLRFRCQAALGEVQPALRTLRGLEAVRLDPELLIDLAEVAVRFLGQRADDAASRDWASRAEHVAGKDPILAARAALIAAEAASDRGDQALLASKLEAARPALDDEGLAGRWHRVRGLLALGHEDGPALLEHLGKALRDRRRLHPAEAGRLWTDLAYGRALVDDLPGAERAYHHARRLLGRVEGPSESTLGLYNLAELRLRRGHLEGVQEALEISSAENRARKNTKGWIQDLELWIRLELTRGRCTEALARCSEAEDLIAGAGFKSRSPIIALLAARAHGWQGDPKRAAERLAEVASDVFSQIEPEERSAIWAHAGRLDIAAEIAAGTAWLEIWATALARSAGDGRLSIEGSISARVWRSIERLEPYRRARLIFDLELASPGLAPPDQVRRAVEILRSHGANAFAERLEGRAVQPWRALTAYLDKGDFGEPEATARLFSDDPDVRLIWTAEGEESLLVGGAGGDESLAAEVGGGRLRLDAPRLDSRRRALFRLAERDLERFSRSRAATSEVDVWASRRAAAISAAKMSPDAILGESEAIQKLKSRLDRLAAGKVPILILGESGTGKELAARRVHDASSRSGEVFVPINCAAIPRELASSELFGHARGAYTSAESERMGMIQKANGGTLFLDEIGDLDLSAQGKLLRVLQEGELRRVGENYDHKIDVRVVAATHRDLEGMVHAKEFRGDLLYRLKVGTLAMPPLRERGDDLLLLAEAFLQRASQRPLSFSDAARRRLLAHPWPGNVRELKNVVEAAAALAEGSEIRVEHLDLPEAKPEIPTDLDYHQAVEEFRRGLIREALAAANGNRAEAARRLGMTRQALSYMAKQLGLV